MGAARALLTALAATALLLMGGCMRPPVLAETADVRLTPLRSISTLEGRVLLRLAGVEGLPVRHAVDCYRMEYPGVGRGGEAVRLTGLLALPRGSAARRLVSFQHGTSTTRSAVPSNLDGTGMATAILFAGNGYALVAPDYPGMGGAPGKHPYYVPEAIGPAVADMVQAAQGLTAVPDAPVFLAGFSEGGWASLVGLRVLEARGRPVLGVASVAGPVDLRNVALPAAMRGGSPSHALYLAYAAWGMADHYRQPLETVLTPEYAAITARVFAGAKPAEILDALPAEPRRLFNRAFLDAYDGEGRHWFLDAFSSAGLTDLAPRAPVRLYYGSRDVDVVPEDAVQAARAMRSRGLEVTAIDVGPVGHDASMLAAAPRIFAWLEELDTGPARR